MILRLCKRAADNLRRMMGLAQYEKLVPNYHPMRVLALIPRSHFTKTGPGVRANARRAFYEMTRDQRRTAVSRGWFPYSMLPKCDRHPSDNP